MNQGAIFDAEYAKLNTGQKKAVDAIEGPVLVVAGPGTGKTKILTMRIANILRCTDTAPENILALTFTDAAAAEMKKRLVGIVGPRGYRVPVLTFHAFCNSVIQENPEAFPRVMGSRAATEVDAVRIFEDIFENLPTGPLKSGPSSPFSYLSDTQKAISTLKRENVSPGAFAAIVRKEQEALAACPDAYHDKGPHKGKKKADIAKAEEKLAKNASLADIYAKYQKGLQEKALYDFDDMIGEVAAAMEENENMLRSLQEAHQYILVDEHQDTNNAQNRILELLANFHESPNIFVVGDKKQSIYRFQGASAQNFSYFEKLYPNAKRIVLRENYRSSMPILFAAEGIIKGEEALIPAAGHPDTPVRILAFSGDAEEEYCIARDIEERIQGGVPGETIAILARTNEDAQAFARVLGKLGVPYILEGDRDIFEDKDIVRLLSLARSVADFGDEKAFVAALHAAFLGIAPLDIYKILVRSRVRDERAKRASVLDIARSKPMLDTLDLENAERVHDVYKKISSWAAKSGNEALPNLFERIIRESGYLEYILSSGDPLGKMDALTAVFDEVKKIAETDREADMASFFRYLETLERHGVRIKRPSSAAQMAGRVRIMTAHKAKGLQFGDVYVPRAYDGKWGGRRGGHAKVKVPESAYLLRGSDIGSYDEDEDEKKLFYVAVTRAEKRLTISYGERAADGKDRLITQLSSGIPEELLLDKASAAGIVAHREDAYAKDKKSLFSQMQTDSPGIEEAEFIWATFAAHGGLSVTHLNNYLECPWRWFYINLLRVPAAQEPPMMYGTAAHDALRDLFDALREREAGKDFLLEKFRYYLMRQPLAEKDFEQYLGKGLSDLGGWYDKWSAVWNRSTRTELPIRDVYIDDIPINGKIDKLEFLDPVRVNVVDYKTGQAKTRGEIEGETKNSDGGVKRQLVFYSLLLSLYKEGAYRMESGEIDFLAPMKNGGYRKERFEITGKEVEDLTQEIRRVAGEIKNAAFWNTRCGGKRVGGKQQECEWCKLREMMKQ